MKYKLFRTIFMVTKHTFYCLSILAISISTVFAEGAKAQIKSVKDVVIQLDRKNGRLGEVLESIEQKSDFRFFYTDKSLDTKLRITLPAQKASVADHLLEIARQTGIHFRQVNNTISVKKTLFRRSQEDIEILINEEAETITGRVTDENGEGLPGATVLVVGTTIGTITDYEGKFTLDVPENATLRISYVGYETVEIAVGDRKIIEVALVTDAEQLAEIVVIGYGTQKKENVTGSVSKVDMGQMANQPNTNITQAIRGRVSGVQFIDNGRPGQSGEILIRGQRSISAENDPLIVLDGAFFNGELADINPNDIESMEILKDASAAAIYGSRAANGVILITSKSGRSSKPQIRFNTYVGFSDWSYKIPLFSPEGYLKRRQDYVLQNDDNVSVPPPVESFLDGPTELEMYEAGKTVDPWEFISQEARQQSYNLSVSGRTDRTRYFISGSFVDEDGLIYGDRASRTSLRLNLENDITDWLTIGINSLYSRRDASGVDANTATAYWLSPYAKVYDDNGELVPYPVTDQLVLNPLFSSTQIENEEIFNNLFANTYAIIELPFLKGFSYRFNYNPNIRWEHDYAFTPIYKQNGINNIGSATKLNVNRWDWQMENIITYQKEIGDHAFDVTLLYGRNHGEMESTQVDAEGFFNDANGWNNLQIAQLQTTETEASSQEGVSSMARLNYRYKGRYMLTLTARRDGSSVFGDNNKYGTFPSVAAAWVLSEEPFMQGTSNFMDFLKLRLSYGAVGNQAISSYMSLDQSESGQYVFGDGSDTYTGIHPSPDNMPNPNLRWETTLAFNTAVDFELLDRRIGGTIEYYQMNTHDLLLYRSLPQMSGFYGTTANIGATSNKGFELTLNTLNVKKNDFEWSSSVVFSTNKNRIVHLYGSDVDGDGKEDDDIGNEWFVGQPIDVTYDYVFDGIYQEGDEMPDGYRPGWVRVKDVNEDGEITGDDRTVLGQEQPKYRWGINNTIRYKGLSFSFFINAMQGWQAEYNLLDYSPQTGNSFPARSLNMIDVGYWTPENRSNTRPSLNWTNPLRMGFYQSRDFVRLQDVTLAYDFSDSFLDKIGLTGLRVYISGRNLATFTDWMGTDPESGYNNVNDLYPTSRTIVGGIDISF